MTDTTTTDAPALEGDAFPDPAAAEAEHPDHYEPAEPDEAELAIADDVWEELKNRAQLGAQRCVDGLISIMDTHRNLRTPDDLFASSRDDDDEAKFEVAGNVAEAVRILTSHCPKLEISAGRVVCYYKDHEKWRSKGQTVYGQAKTLDGLMQAHTDGLRVILVVNYHAWRFLNPRQKVFWIYHLLRELDADGKKSRAPDWSGYFEEPGLFGAGVMREMVTMAHGFVKEAPAHVGDPFQLSMLDQIYDGDDE